ncbi:MAG: hypothetical protein JXB18_05845 [Sedimentisphaerales bacterium]|nr:hypothetical protein [Sedimentisphaerales bacterium]
MKTSPISASERLTLQDLGPVKTPDFQNQINFDIVTFEIEHARIESLNKALESFHAKNVTFQNQGLYTANGISVSHGKSKRGSELVGILSSVGAVRVARTVLTTLDQTPELFTAITLQRQHYVFFTTATEISRSFDPGHIGWMIKPKLTSRENFIELEMMPAFSPLIKIRVPQADTPDEYRATNLPPGRLECTLEQGDFLILAPTRNPTRTTIDAMLFNAQKNPGKIRLYVLIFNAAEYS